MPLYYFHVLQPGADPVPDEEGGKFANLAGAREEAIASIRDLVANALRYQGEFRTMAIKITDKRGRVLDTVDARETFLFIDDPRPDRPNWRIEIGLLNLSHRN